MTLRDDDDDDETMTDGERRHRVEDELTFLEVALRGQGAGVAADAFTRARRVLDGTLTPDEARAQIAAKYDRDLPDDD